MNGTVQLGAAFEKIGAAVPGVWDIVSVDDAVAVLDDSAASLWWDVYRDDVVSRARQMGGFPHVPGAEVDAFARAAHLTIAASRMGVDVGTVAEMAVHALRLRDRELAPAPAPAAAPAAAAVSAPAVSRPVAALGGRPRRRRPSVRQVVFCRDYTDRKGRVIAADGDFADVVEWPWFGAPTVRVRDRRGNTVELIVAKSYLARIE